MSQVFSNWQVNGSNPSTVGGTGTTPKYFTAPSANFTSGVSTTPNSTNATGQLNLDTDNQINGQLVVVTAAGDVEVGSGGACPSITIDIQANTGTFIAPIYTTIATTGAVTVQANTNVLYPWFIQARFVGTTGAGTIGGTQNASVDNFNTGTSGLTNVLSNLNFFANPTFIGGPVFGLVVRVTFSVSEPGNKANMYQFEVQ